MISICTRSMRIRLLSRAVCNNPSPIQRSTLCLPYILFACARLICALIAPVVIRAFVAPISTASDKMRRSVWDSIQVYLVVFSPLCFSFYAPVNASDAVQAIAVH